LLDPGVVAPRGSGLLLPLACAGAVVLSGAARAGTEPSTIDYSEKVAVRLIQVEVTAWPTAADPDSCLGLTRDDFRLTVGQRPRSIEAVDWLGASAAIHATGEASVTDPARQPMMIVLFFDLWHLNLFFRDFSCPMTKPLAFDEARRMLREEFVAGDRLLLVTFAGWPRVHHGWIDDPAEGLAALDRLEVSPSVLSARTEHLHDQPWIEGMESLLLALGRYAGPKELIYLGDDFRFDDIALRVYDLAARAQANRVTIHAVDLLDSCRSTPGPGSGRTCPAVGGLGCTPYRVPIALGPMSWNTGGQLFKTASIGTAVRRIREVRGCRYVVSFLSDPGEERRSAPRAIVELNRKGLTLRAPVSFQDPDRPPAEREEQDAIFLLPRFGQGLVADAGLWPLRPAGGKKQRWNALLLARLRRTPGEPWPEDLAEVVVEAAVLGRGGRIIGEFRKLIAGEELAALRDSDEPRLLVFPVEGLRPGEATVALRARGVAPGGEVAANVRGAYTVPEPPGPGQARPWYLADRLARAGTSVTLLPSLDGLLFPEREALVVGYGCRGAAQSELRSGRIVPLSPGASAEVPIAWLDGIPPAAEDGCGWLVGRLGPDLAPGLWRFEPPDDGDGAGLDVEFRVVEVRP